MLRRPQLLAFLGLASVLLPTNSVARAQSREPVDRILAVVDNDPILDSEIRQVISLDLVEREPNEDDESYRRRVLDQMIDQKLRFHEVDRFGFAEVPIDSVEKEVDRIRGDLGGEEALQARLDEVGLTVQDLRQILARQVMVLIYVEERLGARVFVGLEDIQQYYEEVLVPDLRQKRQTVPPIQEVREPIRALLREQRMNEEFEQWTLDLRADADIEDYFESSFSELPPVVHATD